VRPYIDLWASASESNEPDQPKGLDKPAPLPLQSLIPPWLIPSG